MTKKAQKKKIEIQQKQSPLINVKMVPIQNARTNFDYKSLVCKTFYKKCKYNMLVALKIVSAEFTILYKF